MQERVLSIIHIYGQYGSVAVPRTVTQELLQGMDNPPIPGAHSSTGYTVLPGSVSRG